MTVQKKIDRQRELEANKEYVPQVTEQDESDDDDKGDAGSVKIDGIKKKDRIVPPPNLQNLLFNLEAANSHPSDALKHLKQLAKDVDKVLENTDIAEQNFAVGLSKMEIEENIETFMQNSQLLIDNHYEMQSIMLTVLAKLCIIRFHDFGIACFNTLKDLMKSGREMEELVVQFLKNQVINKMKQHDPTVIPVTLLKGLYELIEDSEIHSLLNGMYDTSFPLWLRLYNEKIEFCKKQG